MKTTLKLMFGAALLTSALVFTSCKSSASKQTDHLDELEQLEEMTAEYTCPMHPEVVQDKPGNCPQCGMTLVEKEAAEETMPADTMEM